MPAALPKPVTKTGDSFRDRPFSELIAERKADLEDLRARVAAAAPDAGYDDIALVRYLLGFGTVANTLAAIQAAEQVKRDKAEVLRAAAEGRPLACAERIEPHQRIVTWAVSEDCVLYIVRAAEVDGKALLRKATAEELVDYGLYLCRKVWLWADRTSRELGRLRKYDVVADFHGFDFMSWDKIPPAAYRQAMSRVSELSEVLHPLAQGSNTVVGLPGAGMAKRLMSAMRPFLPKSMTQSQLCLGSRSKQPLSACPFLASRMAAGTGEQPPDFLLGRKAMDGDEKGEKGTLAGLAADNIKAFPGVFPALSL